MSDIITVADFTSLKDKVNALRASTNIPSTNSYDLSEEAPHSQIISNATDTVTRGNIIYKSDLANLDTKIYKTAYYSQGYSGLGSGSAQGTKRHDSGDFFKTGSTLLNSDSIDTASDITARSTKIKDMPPSYFGDKADSIKAEANRIKHGSHANHASHSSSYTYSYTNYRHSNHGSHGSHANHTSSQWASHTNYDNYSPLVHSNSLTYTIVPHSSSYYSPHSSSPGGSTHSDSPLHGSHSSHASSYKVHVSS